METKTGSAFRQLRVWQEAMGLAEAVYKIAQKLPREEQFALASQIRRCSVSIPSNIAEGSKRGKKEFAQFLRIASGSGAELETQLLLAQHMHGADVHDALEILTVVQKMLESLSKKL